MPDFMSISSILSHTSILGDGEYDMVHHSDGPSSDSGSTMNNRDFLITLNYKQVCVCVRVGAYVWRRGAQPD